MSGFAAQPRDSSSTLNESPRRMEWVTTVGLIALLLTYANGGAWWATRRDRELTVGVSRAHMSMLGLMLLWGRVERIPAATLGLGTQGLGRSLLFGMGVACAGTLPIRLFFGLPRIARWP